MRQLVPWLAVLLVIIVLHALKLRPLATLVAFAWLGYCVWTWVRPGGAIRRRAPRGDRPEDG